VADDDGQLQQEIEDHAKKVGLGPFRSSRTTHYLAIGDAPDAFREGALKICEALARDFLEHFRFKGFEVTTPKQRLAIVTLANTKSCAAFSGDKAPPGVGGFFDGEKNWLVIFDNRTPGQSDREQAERDNLISLAHEATHQLTFNTGLLDLAGDVPTCINEGLGTYGETRRPKGSTKLGQSNPGRIEAIKLGLRSNVPWVPLPQLLTDDDLFLGKDGDATLQLAYGQSWLFVFELMSPLRPSKFRDYLKAIKQRKDPSHRLADAAAHLGDLTRLDQQLRLAASKLSGV
jgi:hypothetical protein